MVVFLFNSVIYVYLLLCLCILNVYLCTFIVMYVLYSVSLCCFVYCLCVNVYLHTNNTQNNTMKPGLNPVAVNQYINKTYHMSTGQSTINTHTIATFVERILQVNFL